MFFELSCRGKIVANSHILQLVSPLYIGSLFSHNEGGGRIYPSGIDGWIDLRFYLEEPNDDLSFE
jgi:hypothetical protein